MGFSFNHETTKTQSVFRFAMVFFAVGAPFSLTKLPWMECNYPETSTGMQGSKSRSTILVEDFSFVPKLGGHDMRFI